MPIIQSLDRALNILDLFNETDRELRITEISNKLGLNKSTAHSLLKTLKMHDYIKQNDETGKYSLGLKLVERGNYALSTLDIRTVAKPYLTKLSAISGQTVHLVVLDGKTGVYIDKVEGTAATIVFSRIGKRVPIHSSAVGKVLVAFKTSEEIGKLIAGYEFFQQTSNTITEKSAYLQELEQVSQSGFATDNEENEPGVCCIAVPVYNYKGGVTAAISMSSPISRITLENKDEMIALLKETALSISLRLGYRNV